MSKFKIKRPDDFHVHLRQGEMLKKVAKYTEAQFGKALVMPNLIPPILTNLNAWDYLHEIKRVTSKLDAYVTIKLTNKTTREIIRDASAHGIIAGKLYPEGVTTNSEDGVADIQTMYPIFEMMEKSGMILCLHGEQPGTFVMDREDMFLHVLMDIALSFPRLKIVLEHITTSASVSVVKRLPSNVAATITVHHLMITLDDVIGGMLNPHLFCKPIAKHNLDRHMLIEAATSGNPKFFLGTDSAPHEKDKKECASGCAGIFSAPVAMQCLAEVFEKEDSLDRLEAFTSYNGSKFYNLPLNDGEIVLEKKPFQVPEIVEGIVPFMAGKTLQWSIV